MAREIKPKEAPEGETKAQDKNWNAVVRAASGLNIRVGPHRSYSAIGILPDSTKVEILELPGGVKVPGWYLATSPDYTGWVDAEFIALPEAE